MKKYLQYLFSIKENTDYENTKSSITNGIALRGYNLWILVCSSVLACIGLDTNSTAVIIGAMLISPLMSPILGVGLSVAVYDRHLLLLSLKNLGVAVIISLSASILYFFLSPLGEPTPELQARTFPTLLDVMVALFGGIAGIVSISRNQQTNAIPGVAIATALMPPLCTTGFGIATGHWNFFFGAFYLFIINAIFISLATYLFVRYLHFPLKEFVNRKVAKKYRQWFIVLSLAALTPSIYFLYTVYRDEVIKREINELVLKPIKEQGNEILKWELENKDTIKLIKVYHSGMPLSDSLKGSIDSALSKKRMNVYQLVSMRVNLTKEEVNQLSSEAAKQIIQEMHVEELRKRDTVNHLFSDTSLYNHILKEVQIEYPDVDTLINGSITLAISGNKTDTIPIVIYKTAQPFSKIQSNRLYNFLRARLGKDSLVLIRKGKGRDS